MKRYTFRIGCKLAQGIELHVAAAAEDLRDAIRIAQEQLYEQLDERDRFKLDLDFGLQALVIVNVKAITEDNLISVEKILPTVKVVRQLDLNLQDELPARDDMIDFMFVPGGMKLVPLADSAA